jgi:hypothetical protein
VTIAILRDIRDQLVGTNKRIDETNKRLDETNRRLDDGFRTVNERIDLTNDRLAIVETTVRDCAQQLVLLGRYVENTYERLDARVAKLENPRTP